MTRSDNPKSKILYVAGPTGVGKSAFALELAVRLDAEIVGADAFQVYEDLPILTARPTEEQCQRVPHHLVGCVPVSKAFDVHGYARAAGAALADIANRGKRALVVGGTGLYFRVLIDGLAGTPPPNPALRTEMSEMALPDLVEWLRKLDPAAPDLVDAKNRRRVERAIEVVGESGRPLREFRSTRRMDAHGLLLIRDRVELAARIEANVRGMFDAGVVGEVAALGADVGPTAARAIGLREVQALLHGETTRAECEAAIAIATRQYAKRQLTWFRNQTTFPPLELTQFSPDAVESAMKMLAPK